MQPQHKISSPRQAGDYAGRDSDCLASLRPSVADLVGSGEILATIIAGGMTGTVADLVRRAERAGWTQREAETAIRSLAREFEGAKGAIFD
ncbi:MAG TPA: hypothetical protein VGN93_23200 [Shinella sp.]|uniref:hypothetical protein n=1 Tax=Shinella sp. TaxID=1870904 RepID=UPI002E164E0E|nr:hypothetical protein [Shinella sp.]